MKRYLPRSWAFRAAALAILVPVGLARSGGIDTTPTAGGAWRAEAYGKADISPLPSPPPEGAIGGLALELLNEWKTNERGYDRAEAPADALKSISILTFSVPTGNTVFLPVELGMSFQFANDDPGNPGRLNVLALKGNVTLSLEVPIDDDYFARVETHAVSNAASDVDVDSDGFHTSSPAGAEAQSAASAPGDGSVLPQFFHQAWGIFSLARFLVDDVVVLEHMTQWSRDKDGNVTTINLSTDLPGGPLDPGADYFADGSFAGEIAVTEGAHSLRIEQRLWGFLETRADLIPEPASVTLFVLGLGGLAWHRRKERSASLRQ